MVPEQLPTRYELAAQLRLEHVVHVVSSFVFSELLPAVRYCPSPHDVLFLAHVPPAFLYSPSEQPPPVQPPGSTPSGQHASTSRSSASGTQMYLMPLVSSSVIFLHWFRARAIQAGMHLAFTSPMEPDAQQNLSSLLCRYLGSQQRCPPGGGPGFLESTHWLPVYATGHLFGLCNQIMAGWSGHVHVS